MKVIALVLALLLPGIAAQAEEVRHASIVGVIDAQLEAFRRDDGSASFSFATRDIQVMFGTPADFLKMVAEAYQAVYRPREVTYADLIQENDRLVQRVLFTKSDDKRVLAFYMMARQPDRTWRIAGCVLFELKGQPA